MRRLLALVALVPALAACGGHGNPAADLPAGQHDLGHGVAVAVRQVVDPVHAVVPPGLRNPVQPGTRWVGVELEYFNRSDKVVNRSAFAYWCDVHLSDGRQAGEMPSGGTKPETASVPSNIPPHSSARGWMVYAVRDGEKVTSLLQKRDDPYAAPVVISL
jgi:hypothetical protein